MIVFPLNNYCKRQFPCHCNELSEKKNIPNINAPMNTAVSLENKQTSIFKELISQRDSDEISFFNALSQERIIQNNLERYTFEHKERSYIRLFDSIS